MKVDDALCTTCSLCAQVCSLVKHGEVNEARSAVRIFRDPFEGRERVLVCRGCEARPCLEVCAAQALSFGGRAIRIDRDRCNLCLTCVDACPFGGVHVSWDPTDGKPLSIEICDGCADEYPCVPFCTTGALSREPALGHKEESV